MSTPPQQLPPPPTLKPEDIYSAINQHWVHAEQTRWWLLYDFLMANSIIILAWAGLFAVQATVHARPILLLLCGAGLLLSFFWLALSLRANSFVNMYGTLGNAAESGLPGELPTVPRTPV